MTIAFPHPPGHGGPGSFQTRFEVALKALGWQVAYPNSGIKPDLILVVGGTRRLGWLFRMKRAGVPIIYRLDGINWLHRKLKVSLKYYVKSEIRNLLSQFIRKFLADAIIYQSQFVIDWWQRSGWRIRTTYYQIYNGVDLEEFKPRPRPNSDTDLVLLCLEGTLDYSPYAIELLNNLQDSLTGEINLVAYGGFQNDVSRHKLHETIIYGGKLTRTELPMAYRNAIYLSLDVNAACPNTVVEALASGIPVVGFDTGALKELVGTEAGCIVPYGSDPWELQMPDTTALISAIREVKQNYKQYAHAAHARAEEKFGMDKVFGQYIRIIGNMISENTHNNKK